MAFNETQQELNNLRNLTWQNGKLIELMENGAGAISKEVESGKKLIAQAINDVGGEASEDESLSELAQDIEQIPSKGFYAGNVKLIGTPVNALLLMCQSASSIISNIEEIEDDTIQVIQRSNIFQSSPVLKKVKMSNCYQITGGYVFSQCSSLKEVNMPTLRTITGGGVFQGSSIEELYMPSLEGISGSAIFTSNTNYRHITWGKLTNFAQNTFNLNLTDLRSITIGQDTNINLPFPYWTATNVIAEGQSGIDELNSNLQTNLISKLYQGGNKILRLGAALYDVTTQETRDMVTAKGWTLQRG